MELKTPLYDCHLAAGGKMVPFAGYLLPVQYEKSGIIAEHMAVREKAGLFDVSHMGEFFLSGSDALNTLNHLLCNNYTTLRDGAVRYSPLCNETGGILDDLLVYRIRENGYFIVVNAANRHKDFCWMQNHLCGDASLEDRSDSIAQLALQGPLAQQILQRLVSDPLPQKYYTFIERLSVAGIPCLVSRTGYTGEDGFELYCAPESAPALWNALLSAGAGDGLIPCALGARATYGSKPPCRFTGTRWTKRLRRWKPAFPILSSLKSRNSSARKRCLPRHPSADGSALESPDAGLRGRAAQSMTEKPGSDRSRPAPSAPT